MSAFTIVPCPPTGCHVCSQRHPVNVSLGELANNPAEPPPVPVATVEETPIGHIDTDRVSTLAPPDGWTPGHDVDEVHDLVREGFAQMRRTYFVESLVVCEDCLRRAGEVIQLGDVLEAENARDEAVGERDQAREQTQTLETKVRELEDAAYVRGTVLAEAQAELAAARRRVADLEAAAAPTNGKTSTRRKATA